MLHRIFGECETCGAPARPFAGICADCGTASPIRPAQIAALAGVSILLLAILVGANRLWHTLIAWRETNFSRLQHAPALFGPPGPTARPNTEINFAWIEKAMADCDREARRHLDALYFLVTPLAATNGNVQRWTQISLGNIGSTITLLASKDALSGLREGSLAVFPGQFVFSIVESTTNVTYTWKPATGVSEFVMREALAVKSFKPGFQILGTDGETAWATTPAVQRPACYWLSALLHT